MKVKFTKQAKTYITVAEAEEARAEAAQKKQAAMDQVNVGDVMDGTVETLKDYGAFVRLENGLSGLVHVSQISDKRVTSPSKVLKEGETVKVKVTAKGTNNYESKSVTKTIKIKIK